jgi:hypothetical protein
VDRVGSNVIVRLLCEINVVESDDWTCMAVIRDVTEVWFQYLDDAGESVK